MGNGASRSRLHMSPSMTLTDDATALKLAAAGVMNTSASGGGSRGDGGHAQRGSASNSKSSAATAIAAAATAARGGDAKLCSSHLQQQQYSGSGVGDVVAGTALRTSKTTVTSSDSPGVEVPIPLRESDICRYNDKYNKHHKQQQQQQYGSEAATADAAGGAGEYAAWHGDDAVGGDGDGCLSPQQQQQQRRSSSFSRVTYAMLDDIFGPEDGDTKYIKRQVIGKGAFGEAYIVERNANYNPARHARTEAQYQNNNMVHPTKPRMLYAAKVMDLHSMPTRDRHYAQTEIFCLAHTDHFAVIKYYEHYILDSDDETLVIITEFANHGDLYHNLCRGRIVGTDARTRQPIIARLQLLEREAGTYFVQLLLALHHIHSRRMMHRDVKSANLFLTSNGIIKLGDFGFSQKYESTVSSESIAGTFLGTPYYLSPEMWRGMRYGKKADVWAAGMVLYEMLMDGQRPFDARTLPELREMVLMSEVTLPECPPPLQTPPSPSTWGQQQQLPAANEQQQTRHDGGDGDAQAEATTASSAAAATAAVDAETAAATAALLARPKRGRFSSEMRELVQCIFQRDPSKRPSAEELLHLPIMQHYLCVFEKHARALCAADDARLAREPHVDALTLHFPDAAECALLLRCIDEAKAFVAREVPREVSDSGQPHYEGVVYKDNRNNVWKERYLVLADSTLTISLGKGKEAVSGTERSKKVPLKLIKAVSPCEPTSIVVAPSALAATAGASASSSSHTTASSLTAAAAVAATSASSEAATAVVTPSAYQPPYAFAISMDSSNSIVFGVATAEELDRWLTTLLRALQIN